MKIGTKEVTAESKSLGECEFPIFETLDECVNDSVNGLGEIKVIELVNAQVRTNSMNIHRAAYTKGPTKGALRSDAMNEIIQEVTSGEHEEIIGNKAALDALIERRMSEIESRMKAALVPAGVDDD